MRWKSSIAFWIPFTFAAFLSGLMLWNREAAWAAFYSFLPMVFFFTGSAFMELAKRIRRLEERIRTLEGKA
jgi:hypothetical protein